MNRNHPALLVFAKYPEAGRVKTRLARGIGSEAAAKLYRCMAEVCIQTYALVQTDCTVYFDPPEEKTRFEQWLGNSYTYLAQPPGSLAEKLQYGITRLLEHHSCVIALGTDSPTLPTEFITQAIESLATHDVVLGPTADGGYYLIGLSKEAPGLFENIDWSTERVLSQTLQACRRLSLSTHCLQQWHDIDEPEDLVHLHASDHPQLCNCIKELNL